MIMRYTFRDLTEIEQTVEKLDQIARIVWEHDTLDRDNVRQLLYIVAELKAGAACLDRDDMIRSVQGLERASNLIKVN